MGAETDPHIAAAHARLLKDASIQFRAPSAPQADPPPWLVRGLEALFKALGPVLGWLLVGLVLAAAASLLYPLARRWLGGPAPLKRPLELSGSLGPPTRERARALLEEADALADAGAYGQGARVLLRRSIQDVEDLRPRSVPASATAREIAVLAALTPEARACFSKIALAVERFAFAGEPMDAEAYRACRALYAEFALPARRRDEPASAEAPFRSAAS